MSGGTRSQVAATTTAHQEAPASRRSGSTESSRQNNLLRIAQKKAQVKTWPRSKKLEKLAIYSSCKVRSTLLQNISFTLQTDSTHYLTFQTDDGCKCNGWKNPNPPPTPPRLDVSQPLATLLDPCRSCSHVLGFHHFFS